MKNIILQHYTGELGELEILSRANISKYAEFCGAEYQLVQGNVFRRHLSPPCQKLIMLDEMWDDYDMVVMVDIDMFTRSGMTKNIFTDASGIGRHYGIQTSLRRNLTKRFPLLGNEKNPYWGGSIYRLDLKTRKTLRKHIAPGLLNAFHKNYEDEGIMHALAVKANMKEDGVYLENDIWNRGSFEENVESANIIHIRTKIKQGGPKRPKIENYRALVERGLIDEDTNT